jgi:metal-dependent amidase/aminoacylase/carboxypeptidase family protein
MALKPNLIAGIFSLISAGLLISCNSTQEKLPLLIEDQTAEILSNLVELRRDLHQHPELSGQEKRTSQIVANYLTGLGLEVNTDIAGYGVIGVLNPGKEGKKIAWRADMDAIPIAHSDSTDFASQVEGVGHMCGHDVHTTIGLGLANILTTFKADIDGTVYFIFQPSEENFTGAKLMTESKVFGEMNLDEIYALHIFPSETGVVSTKPNELFAYEKTLKITLNNTVNQAEFTAYFQKVMQSFIRNRPDTSPSSLALLTDKEAGLENLETIYQDYLILLPDIQATQTDSTISLTSTFFETDRNKLDSILNEVRNQVLNSTFQDHFVSITYSRGNPTVDNDPKLVRSIMNRAAKVNTDSFKPIYGQVPYFNEDFIYFQREVPGVLFFLGASNKAKGLTAMPHSPDFTVDEEAIRYGVNYFSSLILDRVNN